MQTPVCSQDIRLSTPPIAHGTAGNGKDKCCELLGGCQGICCNATNTSRSKVLNKIPTTGPGMVKLESANTVTKKNRCLSCTPLCSCTCCNCKPLSLCHINTDYNHEVVSAIDTYCCNIHSGKSTNILKDDPIHSEDNLLFIENSNYSPREPVEEIPGGADSPCITSKPNVALSTSIAALSLENTSSASSVKKGKRGRTARVRLRMRSSTDRGLVCDEDPVLVNLCQWMRHQNSAYGQAHDQRRMCGTSPVTRHQLASCGSLRAAVFPGTGRGLMAVHNLAAGDEVVSIPRHLLINCQDVLRDEVLKAAFDKTALKFTATEILAVFLLYNKLVVESSYWLPYINSLPTSFLVPSEEEASSYPLFIGQKLASQLKILTTACSRILKVFQYISCQEVSKDDIEWGFMAVNSRSVYLQIEDHCEYLQSSDNGCCALAPYLDLLNHSYNAEVSVKLDKSDQCYKIITHVPYRKYEQVFINYGPHDNVKLFVEYGFFIPNNPHDGYPVQVEAICSIISHLPNDKSFVNSLPGKLKIISGLEESKVMYLCADGPSWSLEAVMAILLQPPGHADSWRSVYGDVARLPHYPVICRALTQLIEQLVKELQVKLQTMQEKRRMSLHFTMGCNLVAEYLCTLEKCQENHWKKCQLGTL